MESRKPTFYIKWLLIFLFITVCSYLVYYTSQPHYHISLDSIGSLLILSSLDPGIAIISFVTGVILTAIAYYEFKKRSDKALIE
jgi:hypothetical protein